MKEKFLYGIAMIMLTLLCINFITFIIGLFSLNCKSSRYINTNYVTGLGYKFVCPNIPIIL